MDPQDHSAECERELAYKLRGTRTGLTREDFYADPDGDYDYRKYCKTRNWICTLDLPSPPMTKTDIVAVRICVALLLVLSIGWLAYAIAKYRVLVV